MTKEEKINMALAFLAPILFEGRETTDDIAPQVTFLSSNEVQIDECPGILLATNKVYPENPLADTLKKIVDHNITEERKHWECCVHEDYKETEYQIIDGGVKYDPNLVADHAYHSIHLCSELIDKDPDK